MDKETEQYLKNQAKEIRKMTIEQMGNLGTGHIGEPCQLQTYWLCYIFIV